MSGTYEAREGPAVPAVWTQAPSFLEEVGEGQDVVRVLLVEDDPDYRLLVREMLREAASDAVLTSCDRLSAGLAPLAGGLADLVLLDLSLPDADGLEGLRQLRKLAPDVPVVILTGNTDVQTGVHAVRAGAQDYLVKGRVDGESLARAMRHAVERQRIERHLTGLALRDALTGLPNRVLFADRLDHALATSDRLTTGDLVVMFIDLDGFKAIKRRARSRRRRPIAHPGRAAAARPAPGLRHGGPGGRRRIRGSLRTRRARGGAGGSEAPDPSPDPALRTLEL